MISLSKIRHELKEDEILTRINDARQAEKRESARTALQMGLSNEQVSKITGLSIEEINKIKEKIQ